MVMVMDSFRSASLFHFVVILMLTVQSDAVSAKPLIVVKNQTYDVGGLTVAELRNQMDKKGPKGFWGYTSWRYFLAKQGCRVKVEIKYTLPN